MKDQAGTAFYEACHDYDKNLARIPSDWLDHYHEATGIQVVPKTTLGITALKATSLQESVNLRAQVQAWLTDRRAS